MNYKEQIEKIRSIFLHNEEVKEEKVELAEDVAKEEEKVEEPAAPAVEYATAAQFAELSSKTEKFMESVTEMLSTAMEMINSTEKNTVPVEASAEEKVEFDEESAEVVEEVELSAEPVKHVPTAPKRADVKIKLNGGARKTAADRAFETWINAVKE